MFEPFIARQAILKDNLTLFAYELRFRAEDSGAGQPSRSPRHTWSMLPLSCCRWESLTANALAIVALGEQELLSGVALILPRAKAVIAIGYRLALAGWAGSKEQGPLAAMADFLLVDMLRRAAANMERKIEV